MQPDKVFNLEMKRFRLVLIGFPEYTCSQQRIAFALSVFGKHRADYSRIYIPVI
jgi:hypothetical protein